MPFSNCLRIYLISSNDEARRLFEDKNLSSRMSDWKIGMTVSCSDSSESDKYDDEMMQKSEGTV